MNKFRNEVISVRILKRDATGKTYTAVLMWSTFSKVVVYSLNSLIHAIQPTPANVAFLAVPTDTEPNIFAVTTAVNNTFAHHD